MKNDLSLSKRCWCCAIGEAGQGWPLWHVPSRACPLMSCNDVMLDWVAVHAARPVPVLLCLTKMWCWARSQCMLLVLSSMLYTLLYISAGHMMITGDCMLVVLSVSDCLADRFYQSWLCWISISFGQLSRQMNVIAGLSAYQFTQIIVINTECINKWIRVSEASIPRISMTGLGQTTVTLDRHGYTSRISRHCYTRMNSISFLI